MAVRNGIIGVAAAVAVVLGGGAIGSAEAAAPQVSVKELPTLAQAAKIVPGLKGGTTESEKFRVFAGNMGNCTGTRKTRLSAGRISYYWAPATRAGQYPHSALVEVSRFKSTKQAKRALTDYAAYVRNCKDEVAEVGTTMKKATLPRIGDQRVGLTMTFAAKESGVTSTAVILVRKGRTVVQTVQWAPRLKLAQTIKLERLALRRAR